MPDCHLIGTYDPKQADASGFEPKRLFAFLPSQSIFNFPEPDFVICVWRTSDAKRYMTPEELMVFFRRVVAHVEAQQAALAGD